jgi:hypothetical protein
MTSAPFPLFTSIRPPKDAAETGLLRSCLASWTAAGFQPVAVNGPAETEALRSLNLPVEFSIMASDGKPRIGAILSAIRKHGCKFSGIINSDCKIVCYPNLAANLAAGLEGRAAVAWRLDVGGRRTRAQRYGFVSCPAPSVSAGAGMPSWSGAA